MNNPVFKMGSITQVLMELRTTVFRNSMFEDSNCVSVFFKFLLHHSRCGTLVYNAKILKHYIPLCLAQCVLSMY